MGLHKRFSIYIVFLAAVLAAGLGRPGWGRAESGVPGVGQTFPPIAWKPPRSPPCGRIWGSAMGRPSP